VGAYILEPRIGYDNEVNKAGYLFTDAYTRDTQAWNLANSSNSLMTAFDEKLVSDQYGGLLWVSSLIYRHLSPDAHRPLLVTLLAALFGALGVAFVWGTGKRLSSEGLAQSGALVFAFFPEAILQGAAQMREPFLMTFIAMAFYGVVQWQTSRTQTSEVFKTLEVYWIILALAGMFLVSPGFILLTLIAVGGWLYFSQDDRRIPWQALLAALAVFVIAFIALSLSWSTLVAVQGGGPVGVVGNWARETVKWNQQILNDSSGIVQLVFRRFPAGLQLPFVVIYGILQPVLPAAIFEPSSAPFWQILGIVRALGWYVMLPLLAYALFSPGPPHSSHFGVQNGGTQGGPRWLWLGLVVWVWIIIASLRGGADQWDNPRYRVILLGWQAMLAAQAFLSLKQGMKRWWLRILTVEAVLLVVFTHWYIYRYMNIGFNIGIRNTIVLAIGLSILLVLGDWLVEKWKAKAKP
jgi:4-amino-4-deoxy-L-arabinose transferase-like glycosyltransferase